MKEISIEIEGSPSGFAYDMMGDAIAPGASRDIPGPATLVSQGLVVRKAVDLPSTLNVILKVGGQVAIGLVTAWLYDKLKGKNVQLKVDGDPIEIDQESLRQALERRTRDLEP